MAESIELQTFNENVVSNFEEFWVHIFAAKDISDIRGLALDESIIDMLKKLSVDMKIYYNSIELDFGPPEVGKYYAVFDDEWHRVQCNSVDPENQKATVFFIDRGDEDSFLYDALHPLHQHFFRFPAQSLKLSICDLDIFKGCTELQTFVEESLVDKDVFIKVKSVKQEDCDIPTLSVEMFLEKDTEEEVNINNLLLEKMCKEVLNPRLFIGTDKIAQETHISHVSEKSVHMQIRSKGLTYLKVLMRNLTQGYLDNKSFRHKTVFSYNLWKLYVTKHPKDNKWYRVKIIQIENEFEACAKMIDVGSIIIVKKRNLILLEDLSIVLAHFPEQAIEVKLHKIPPAMFDKKMEEYLRFLAPPTEIFHMKVVGYSKLVPIVHFYKRTEDNCLTYINDELILESTIPMNDGNQRNCPAFTQPDFPLKPPIVPEDNSQFDVNVTMAAHPDDFTIQPLCDAHKLEILMKKLQYACDAYSGALITAESITIGDVYAVQNLDDDIWFRGCIFKVISETIFVVYACDYGDFKVVSLENLQPLLEEFHELPYQAIKAKLFGLTPEKKANWTIHDSLMFTEMIVSKSFVSFIKGRQFAKTLLGYALNVELFDTTTDENISISDIINSRKRAESCEL